MHYRNVQVINTSRRCPHGCGLLQHGSVGRYKPNYTVMALVEATLAPEREYQLQASQLQVDESEAGFIGRGGQGTVHRGALVCLVSAAPCALQIAHNALFRLLDGRYVRVAGPHM